MAKLRLRPFYVIPLLVVAGIAVLWWVNHRQSDPSGPPGMPRPGMGGGGHHGGPGRFLGNQPLPVLAREARAEDIHIYLNGLGTVTPLTSITLRTQVSGQLVKVNFKEGQEVKKGDLLAVIDPRPYNVALEQAEGNLLQAQSQLKDAQTNLGRYKQLAQQDSIAQQQVDTEAQLVSQYMGAVKVDQAAIDSAKLNLTYAHIVSPITGRVGLRNVDEGNYVTPGDTGGLVSVTQTKPINVVFSLPEDNVVAVAKRFREGAALPVDIFDRTLTTKLATGTLTSIDNVVDQSTGTFRCKATFPNDDESLYPDQFVNARLLLNVLKDVIVIPTSGIERGEQGLFVYVVQPDNTVTARPVTLGATEGERVQVLSGLQEGDVVVVDGADKLREGMPVVVQKPAEAIPSTGVPAGGGQRKGRRGNFKGKGDMPPGGWRKKQADGSAAPDAAPSAAPSSAPSASAPSSAQ